jgi:hypothetical protein
MFVLEEVMETRFVLQTIFEIAVAGFIIYGLFFEEKFAETERKVFSAIKRYIRRTFSTDSTLSDRV